MSTSADTPRTVVKILVGAAVVVAGFAVFLLAGALSSSPSMVIDEVIAGYVGGFGLLLGCVAAATHTAPRPNLLATIGFILTGLVFLGVGGLAIANAAPILATDPLSAVASARHAMALLIIGPVVGLVTLAAGVATVARQVRSRRTGDGSPDVASATPK